MNIAKNTHLQCKHKQNATKMVQLACMHEIANSANSLKNSLERALNQIRAIYGE